MIETVAVSPAINRSTLENLVFCEFFGKKEALVFSLCYVLLA